MPASMTGCSMPSRSVRRVRMGSAFLFCSVAFCTVAVALCRRSLASFLADAVASPGPDRSAAGDDLP